MYRSKKRPSPPGCLLESAVKIPKSAENALGNGGNHYATPYRDVVAAEVELFELEHAGGRLFEFFYAVIGQVQIFQLVQAFYSLRALVQANALQSHMSHLAEAGYVERPGFDQVVGYAFMQGCGRGGQREDGSVERCGFSQIHVLQWVLNSEA